MNGPGTHPTRKPYGSKDHLTGPCIIPTPHTFHLAKETWVFTQLRMVYLSHDQMSTANFGAPNESGALQLISTKNSNESLSDRF